MEERIEKVSLKNIIKDDWELLWQIRDMEQRFMGIIVSDAIRLYWETYYGDEQDLTAADAVSSAAEAMHATSVHNQQIG